MIYCRRCGELLFDEYVMTEEGSTLMKRCIMRGARYFVNTLKTTVKRCKHCGKEFEVYKGSSLRKVCNECLKKSSRKKKVQKVCILCGRTYMGDQRSVTKYCKKCVAEVRSKHASERRAKWIRT